VRFTQENQLRFNKIIPDINGAPDAIAIPKHNGATKKPLNQMKSDLRLAKD
jgi:hypothetical protein